MAAAPVQTAAPTGWVGWSELRTESAGMVAPGPKAAAVTES